VPELNPDRVLTVNEYYDVPRLGVAELNGVPHVYEAESITAANNMATLISSLQSTRASLSWSWRTGRYGSAGRPSTSAATSDLIRIQPCRQTARGMKS
jgi:hypothetical protein